MTTENFFDTIAVVPKDGVDALRQRAEAMQINVRLRDEEHVSKGTHIVFQRRSRFLIVAVLG